MRKYIYLLMLCVLPLASRSQCLVNSITVNTGYNPITSSVLPTGTHDPKWSVTGISYACRAICSCAPTFQAWVVPPLVDGGFSWATSSSSQWISFLDSTGYASNDTAAYSMELTREFRTCVADSVVLNFQISNDNYISDLDIDGGAILFSQPAVFSITNFTTFTSFTATVYLTPGTHYLNVTVGNVAAAIPMNAHGLNIVGTLASQTGVNSIVKESDTTCNSYVCGSVSCNSLSMPDTVSACVNTTVSLSATVIGSDSMLSIHWTAHAGLSDTTILNPTLNVGTTSAWYYLTIQSLNPTNLVVNGDFSAGNTGFTSSYSYAGTGSSALYPAGVYTVISNPFLCHSGAYSYYDHTTGTSSGEMLAMNGASTPIDVWCQTITVVPGTYYDFSAWFSNWSSDTADNLPIIQFEINGSSLGGSFAFPHAAGVWRNYSSTWYSGTSTSATICIHDAQTASYGNDFAIDDISFQQVCSVTDSVYAEAIPIDTVKRTTDTVICSTSTLATLTAPGGYTTYLWNTGSTSAATGITAAGTYWVTATSACGAMSDTFHVTFLVPPSVNIGNDTGFCLGNVITLAAAEPAGDSYLWSNGSTGTSIAVSSSGTYWLRVSNGCTATDSIHITVFPVPAVSLGPDTTNCDGAAITLESSDTYALPVYLWSNGSTSPAITVTTTGTYWLQVTNGGCPGADTIHVTIFYDTFTLNNHDTAICKGQYVQAFATNDPGGTYQWLPTAGIANSTINNPLITPDTSAMYSVSVSLPGCPVKSDSFYVDVQPNPQVSMGGNRFICLYDTIHVHASVNPAWYSGYIYNWFPATSLDNTTMSNVVFTAGSTATYYVTVTTTAGCAGEDSAQFIVEPGNFGLIGPNQSMCPGDSVQLTASGGALYRWYPSLYLSDSLSATPWVHAVASQSYEVLIKSAAGCRDTVGVTVTVWPNGVIYLVDSVTIYPGESYNIVPQSNCTSFLWFPPDGLSSSTTANTTASPGTSTKYIITAATENGCKAIDSISIIVDPSTLLTIPNAFTPGNGVNGKLFVIARGEASLNYFRIFNRWGNLVFETNNIQEGWDGTYNGTPQPFGVFVYEYQAVAKDGTLFTKHGNVTLIR